jgi:hypothetical protein
MSNNIRPALLKWVCIARGNAMHILAELDQEEFHQSLWKKSKALTSFSTPWEHLRLTAEKKFVLLVLGLSSSGKVIYKRFFYNHINGQFQFQIPRSPKEDMPIHSLKVYEAGTRIGTYFYLGTYLPQIASTPFKVIISDFDKTLVETKYATTKEMWRSIRSPIHHFPGLQKGIDLLQLHIIKGHQSFVVSASPYFYERPIRQWLYQHHIYTATIFLKDYRIILSPMNFFLGTKDIKTHGFYKLSQILTILELTGIPDELVLMGDNYESDPIIYKLVYALLMKKLDAYVALRFIEKVPAFEMNVTQKSFFLAKLSAILSMGESPTSFKILIRTLPLSMRPVHSVSPHHEKIQNQIEEEINDFVEQDIIEYYTDQTVQIEHTRI